MSDTPLGFVLVAQYRPRSVEIHLPARHYVVDADRKQRAVSISEVAGRTRLFDLIASRYEPPPLDLK